MSIEMFEHMRNWRELLERVAGWLTPGSGKAFVHVFRHRYAAVSVRRGRGRPSASSPPG